MSDRLRFYQPIENTKVNICVWQHYGAVLANKALCNLPDPNHLTAVLHTDNPFQLMRARTQAHLHVNRQQYRIGVLYIDACRRGSMPFA